MVLFNMFLWCLYFFKLKLSGSSITFFLRGAGEGLFHSCFVYSRNHIISYFSLMLVAIDDHCLEPSFITGLQTGNISLFFI